MSKVISVRVPENLRIALEAKAQEEGLRMGELVKRSLELSLRSDELELMKTAHEKNIAAIKDLARQSSAKTAQINNYLNLTEQRVRHWEQATKKGIPKYTLIAVVIFSAISAIASIYNLFQ